MSTPCITLSQPKFSFEFTEDGAAHNLEVLRRYDLDLGNTLEAQQNSPQQDWATYPMKYYRCNKRYDNTQEEDSDNEIGENSKDEHC
jgi:hypothetical protein